jgi:hypothetical protein
VRALAGGVVPVHNPALGAVLQTVGVNRFARPSRAGHGLYSGSLGNRQVGPGGVPQIQDYANNRLFAHANINSVVWGSHWGGVIAMDGNDYLTLENYSRSGENAAGAPHVENLFFFNMYGQGGGQEQWETPNAHGKGFANGITMVVQPTAQTGLRYFTPDSKNSSADIAASNNIDTLQRALCNALNYATVHRYATSVGDKLADATRLATWQNAVATLIGAYPAYDDAQTRNAT